MLTSPNTPAPFAPPSAPSDWADVVQGNSFSVGARLGWWIGQITPLKSGDDPSKYILPLANLTAGDPSFDDALQALPQVYILVHGWAPDYRALVQAQNGKLHWWDTNAALNKRWASDWAWAPVGPLTTPPFDVTKLGMAQQIMTMDPQAIVLLYSWIDDSATEAGTWADFMAYRSEAYTHTNGVRLANGLQAIFNPGNCAGIHLIGHSHGSKVCSVAAMMLQQAGFPASHLTILDSPESDSPIMTNSANLLAYYLNRIKIATPTGGTGTIVDCFASCFGVAYASPNGNQPIDTNVVEVDLAPDKIYKYLDYGDEHTYAAGWYSGSATHSEGLTWPPFPTNYSPALNQTFPGGVTPVSQWYLQAGTYNGTTYVYAENPLTVTGTKNGNVSGDPSTALVFKPQAIGWSAYSYFAGSFTCNNTGQYGFAFDLTWQNAQIGDYFVIAGGDYYLPYTLFVMDGQSAPIGKTTVVVNSDVWVSSTEYVWIYFLGSSTNQNDSVTISNFRWISITSQDGSLEKAHEERAAKAAALTAYEAQP